MSTKHIVWRRPGLTLTLGLDEAGEGPTVLLLPALSSISTRGEMLPLSRLLSPRFRAVAIDWPGFGDMAKPRFDWTPDVLSDFLDWVLSEIVPAPFAIVAAGHAAGYALHHLSEHPGATQRLVLVAPTWRGPLPTMTGGQRGWFGTVRAAVDAPVLGSALYAANMSRPVIDRMVAAHVYSDAAFLTPARRADKMAVTRAPGARHASVRFVSGGLDRVGDREAFLGLAAGAGVPILLVRGAETPPRSLAEMEALGALPGVATVRLPKGKLSVHEEFPAEVAAEVLRFLDGG